MEEPSKDKSDPGQILSLESFEKQLHLNYEFQLNQAGFFDKGLLTLSSSSLGILFATKLQSAETFADHPGTFLLAVMCFAVSLLLTIASFQTCIKACKLEIERLTETHRTQTYVEESFKDKIWDLITTILNGISMTTFTIGIASLIYVFAT